MDSNRYARGALCALLIALGLAGVSAQEVLFAANDVFEPGQDQSGRHAYQTRVEAGDTIEVVVLSDDVDTVVRAEFPDGTELRNDDFAGLNAGFLRVINRSGTMTVHAAPLFPDRSGAYQVRATRRAAPPEIRLGSAVDGALLAAGDAEASDGERPLPRQIYRLRAAAGTTVRIDLASRDFDAQLEVLGLDGRRFRNDDRSSLDTDSTLAYHFAADGMVQVVVGSLGGTGAGAFRLSTQIVGSQTIDRISGTLGPGDERGYDGRFVDRFEREARSGDELTIALRATAFDPYLWVSDPAGRTLARDDDAGGNGDSLVSVVFPETGSYTIYVVSSIGGDTGGGYELQFLQ